MSPRDTNALYLHQEGTNYHAYKILGAHKTDTGYDFAVWAPNATYVSLVGDFNNWDPYACSMNRLDPFGVYELHVDELDVGERYKYFIRTRSGEGLHKADPYAFHSELRPNTASITCDLSYDWQDYDYLRNRKPPYHKPMFVYEVHAGTWKRKVENGIYSYTDLKNELIPYCVQMGYTHIEFLPLHEHPFDGSWGYQVTGYYSLTSRYGTPREFMAFVDACHANGLGVILDFVPAHFPKDAHGLSNFDGTALYEPADTRIGEHLLWGTKAFNYSRSEVRSFLISNAMFWFDVYHIDGLRMDAVSGIIYRDYQREPGQWLPNVYGGNENLEGIAFVRQLNAAVHKEHPSALMIAEESTAWHGVTHPVSQGGLGFNFKWNMGWMNDLLKYIKFDPVHRKYYHNLLTFQLMYAFNESYILPLSHDEVVHGKHSLLDKMPGDYWQKFAGLRMFFGYMLAQPGKKLLFMGGEYGQFIEWKDDDSLDWHLMGVELHGKLHLCLRHMIQHYRNEPAFYEVDDSWDGFRWIKTDDTSRSVIAFMRRYRRIEPPDADAETVTPDQPSEHGDSLLRDTDKAKSDVIVVCNFTPVGYYGYYIGAPYADEYVELLNTDDEQYGGTHMVNKTIKAEHILCDGYRYRLQIDVPPLSTIYIKLIKHEIDA